MELLTDAHFWVGIAFVVFLAILVMAGVHKFAWKALGDAATKSAPSSTKPTSCAKRPRRC